jgi:hypothetical protein
VSKRMSALEVVSRTEGPVCPVLEVRRVCVLCREPLGNATTRWVHVPGDPSDLRRVVHARCAHERALLERGLRRASTPQTPLI